MKTAFLGLGEMEPAASGETKTTSLESDETEPAPKGSGETETTSLGSGSASPDPLGAASVSPDGDPYRRQPLQVQVYGPRSKL